MSNVILERIDKKIKNFILQGKRFKIDYKLIKIEKIINL